MGQEFESLDDVQRWALNATLNSTLESNPRNMKTREVIGGNFCLSNPRCRCVTIPARSWSLPLAIGEFCWHLSASDELSFIAYYASRWREYSENQSTISGSCYGKRLFGRGEGGQSQWDKIVRLLRYDAMSRRAILNFQQNFAEALDPTSRDVACASTLQFFVRAGALHAVAYMRSNDVVWGLPYDVFFFTMLQEMLATTLELELGKYYHVAGSLHLYERHVSLAERIMASKKAKQFEMPSMKALHELPTFLEAEGILRSGGDPLKFSFSPYWADLLTALLCFAAFKADDWQKLKDRLARSIYAEVLSPLLKAETV